MKGLWHVSGYTTSIAYHAQRLDLWFWHPAAPNSYPHTPLAQVSTSRCDDEPYFPTTYGGCVFPEVPGWFNTLRLSDPAVQYSTAHIVRAQVDLPDHWAAFYTDLQGPPIHRLVDSALINANRNAACHDFVKQNPDDSCDEYPFASSREGAYLVGRARTSVAHVPLLDNTTGGSRLAAFLMRDRIIDGDPYWITVYP